MISMSPRDSPTEGEGESLFLRRLDQHQKQYVRDILFLVWICSALASALQTFSYVQDASCSGGLEPNLFSITLGHIMET